MDGSSSDKNNTCCVDFDIDLESTGRNLRDTILSIQFFETEVKGKFVFKYKIRIAIKRCRFSLFLDGCEMPLQKRANLNPYELQSSFKSVEVKKSEEKTTKQQKMGASADIKDKLGVDGHLSNESIAGLSREHQIEREMTIQHIQSGGSEKNPTWDFIPVYGKTLSAQFLNTSIGEISIQERPSHINAKVSAWKKDFIVTDSEGYLANNPLKSLLVTSYINSVSGGSEYLKEKIVEIQ